MDLHLDRAIVGADSGSSISERAMACCLRAKQLEKAGEYHSACEALREFWPDTAGAPRLEALSDLERAEVLLRAGSLAGWLGSVEQTGGSQEHGKDLITAAIEILIKAGESDAEAQSDLAVCYWREGAYDEARVLLRRVIDDRRVDPGVKAIALVRVALVEKTDGKYTEAMALYKEARPLVDASDDPALKGTFHNGLGMLLNCRAVSERRQDFIDDALIEFAAASFHFEEAGNERFRARVENNLGYLFFTIGRYKNAHNHLDSARFLFLGLNDVRTAAQVDETRARVLLAERQVVAAERVIRAAVKVLERGDEQAILAEALITQGVALARLGNQSRARAVLERAATVAETVGDQEGAGRARLAIMEELGSHISGRELISIYRPTIKSLKNSEDPAMLRRLISCGESLLATVDDSEAGPDNQLERGWEGFSFKREVKSFEHRLIERALRDSDGLVTTAARLLGFKHHQSLISLLSGRHKSLQKSRSAVRRRRRQMFSERKEKPSDLQKAVTVSQIVILHVEDDEKISRTVADLLKQEGMQVDSCSNGSTALKILKGNTHYDAIILDHGLPGLSGLELTKRVRGITHRRSTPVIMFSANDIEREAWRVGVDEFLPKPEALNEVSTAITRLLKDHSELCE